MTQNISKTYLDELKKNNSEETFLTIIEYLLYDDNAPNVMKKDEIITRYFSFENQNKHINNINNQNENFKTYLFENFSNQSGLKRTLATCRFPIIKKK